MIGTHAQTGRQLDGIDHLRQSIRDILTTPIGARVLRRPYGSRLPELIDNPYSQPTKLAIIAATAEAIMLWEERIELDQINLTSFHPGKITLELIGRYLPDGRAVTLSGIEVT
jgi:phage baseplate assembly protein W